MRPDSVFPKKNPLPCPERTPPVADRNGERCLGEQTTDMRRHIVWTFLIVDESAVAIAHEIRHKSFDISAHIDVRVLRENQRRAGMLNK